MLLFLILNIHPPPNFAINFPGLTSHNFCVPYEVCEAKSQKTPQMCRGFVLPLWLESGKTADRVLTLALRCGKGRANRWRFRDGLAFPSQFKKDLSLP
jgi:hypothetical protein